MRLLLISGSTRRRSSNAAALATVRAAAPPGSVAVMYDGLATLPAFNPDDDHDPLTPAVDALRREIDTADVVLFSTPEYAGTLPGSLKNLLDWTVGGSEMSLKPVAWINVAMPGRGAGALATLETVLGYVGASVVEAACLTVPIVHDMIGTEGLLMDPGVAGVLAGEWTALGAGLQS